MHLTRCEREKKTTRRALSHCWCIGVASVEGSRTLCDRNSPATPTTAAAEMTQKLIARSVDGGGGACVSCIRSDMMVGCFVSATSFQSSCAQWKFNIRNVVDTMPQYGRQCNLRPFYLSRSLIHGSSVSRISMLHGFIQLRQAGFCCATKAFFLSDR